MKRALLIGLLLVAGCRGKQGDKGNNGIAGLRGPGEIVELSGLVASDDFTINDPRIKLASELSVYLSDGVNVTESPYFLPGLGINTYYLADPIAGTIRFFNAKKAAATIYLVTLII